MTNMQLMDIIGESIQEIRNVTMEYPMEEREFLMKKADVTAKLVKTAIDNSKVVLEADKMAGWTVRSDKVVGE